MDDSHSHQSLTDVNFIISFQKIKKCYEKMYADVRKSYNLTQNEIDVLIFIKRHPGLDTAGEIAAGQSLSRSLVCKSVESLLDNHYLIAEEDREDRRFLHLKLTDRAEEILQKLLQVRDDFWSILEKNIKREEMDVFLRVFSQMKLNLED